MGCGNGWLPCFCRDKVHGVRWVGTELWESEISQAAKKGVYSELVQANLLRSVPFKQCAFDVVVCNEVLMYLPSPQMNLSEFYRVLRPRGLLILYEQISWLPGSKARFWRMVRPLALSKEEVPMDSLSSDWQRAKRPARISCFSPRTLRQHTREAGFDIIWSGGFRLFRNRIDPMTYLENWWPWYRAVTAVAQRWPYLATDLMVVARKFVDEKRDCQL